MTTASMAFIFSAFFLFLRGGKKSIRRILSPLVLSSRCYFVLASYEYYYNICMGNVRGQAKWVVFGGEEDGFGRHCWLFL
ncbi:hypothetical protein B0T18DRAFT_410544 [Schizothecium vesticola]|uniref:Uncharacterized protein n=1 Tax=Schizothecium vesticola TaxID=314040 RepID=A0AA40K569_9PEZI|nr:hypothetical protein B0T18DRAFT_410544 [Schizothecium vesticola]